MKVKILVHLLSIVRRSKIPQLCGKHSLHFTCHSYMLCIKHKNDYLHTFSQSANASIHMPHCHRAVFSSSFQYHPFKSSPGQKLYLHARHVCSEGFFNCHAGKDNHLTLPSFKNNKNPGLQSWSQTTHQNHHHRRVVRLSFTRELPIVLVIIEVVYVRNL